MEQWRFEPAHDFGLSAEQRRLSLRREVGLESAISCFLWRSITRFYLAIAHRLRIHGRENLPAHAPFILVANHASHLDAIILGGILPLRFVGAVFPIAAGDTFFTKRASSIFATTFMNALPIWRKNCGAHSLEDLRERLLQGACIYILFPEGTRTRTGEMAPFKPGLGRLVAGTNIPIVPCYIKGTFAALPATGVVPRWEKISARVGKPLSFAETTNDRAGWESIAVATENAVRSLMT
ncbi:MAG TPA: lysophospholipid acyltransferase family protein [Chthoniobacterales bacterium]|nr:lysophospholipid acyltransferase family protein [Chthoniobacterales bacterium]